MRRPASSVLLFSAAVLAAGAVAPTPRPLRPPTRSAGAGYGHGVGMSSYRAEGMARGGADDRCILARYYPGAPLGRVPTDRTRAARRGRALK